MIKTVSLIALAGLLLVTITGCSKEVKVGEERSDFECKQENVKAPTWTCIPSAGDSYAGVGIAEKSAAEKLGLFRAVQVAEALDLLAQGRADRPSIVSGGKPLATPPVANSNRSDRSSPTCASCNMVFMC